MIRAKFIEKNKLHFWCIKKKQFPTLVMMFWSYSFSIMELSRCKRFVVKNCLKILRIEIQVITF